MNAVMPPDLARQLGQWLAATEIGWLELRGPGVHLCLQRHGDRVDVMPAGTPPPVAAAALPVTAASVGVYLHCHPLHDAPLAIAGRPVAAGQPIGLLRIGALLLPVVAPQAGVMLRHRAADGTTVGHGTLLAELSPALPTAA